MKKCASELGDPLYPTINLINIGTAVLKEFGLQQLFNICIRSFICTYFNSSPLGAASLYPRQGISKQFHKIFSFTLFIYLFIFFRFNMLIFRLTPEQIFVICTRSVCACVSVCVWAHVIHFLLEHSGSEICLLSRQQTVDRKSWMELSCSC